MEMGVTFISLQHRLHGRRYYHTAVYTKQTSRFLETPDQPQHAISVFSTLSKSALLVAVAEGISQLKWIYFRERRHRLYDLQVFDEASRGPWGSLQLLWVLRLQAVVASVGAVITVASLAMDPFTQQILAYPEVTVNVTGNDSYSSATIGTANAYDWADYGSLVSSVLGKISHNPKSSFT